MAVKKFVSDALFIQGWNILIKAIWILVIDRAVQNALPAEDYGRYFAMLSFSILFIILLDLGLNSMNLREVASDPQFFQEHFRSIITGKLWLSLAYLMVLTLAFFLMGFREEDARLLIPLAFMQIGVSLNAYLRSNLAGQKLFRLDGTFALLDRLLVIAVCATMLLHPAWRNQLDISNFIWIQLGAVMLVCMTLLFVNIRMLGGTSSSAKSHYVRSIFKKTLPFALLAALMSIYTRMDAVMLKDMLGERQANEYAMGYRLLDALNMVAVLFSGMLLPMFSSRIQDSPFIKRMSDIALRMLLIPAIVFGTVALLYGEYLIGLMYPGKWTSASANCFGILILCFIPISLVYIYGTLLTASKTLKFLNTMAGICVGLNIALNLLWIPRYGIVGAAWTTLITQSVFAAGCMFNAQRRHRALPQLSEWGLWFLFAALVCGMAFPLRQFFDKPLVHMALLLLAAGSAAMILGLIRGKDFKALLPGKR